MAKFLFVSKEGAIPDLAFTVRNEGHNVRMTIEDPHEQEVGSGFVNKIPWDQWRDLAAEWADVIVFDYDGYGEDADKLRIVGRSVVGGTPIPTGSRVIASSAKKLHEVGFDTLNLAASSHVGQIPLVRLGDGLLGNRFCWVRIKSGI